MPGTFHSSSISISSSKVSTTYNNDARAIDTYMIGRCDTPEFFVRNKNSQPTNFFEVRFLDALYLRNIDIYGIYIYKNNIQIFNRNVY